MLLLGGRAAGLLHGWPGRRRLLGRHADRLAALRALDGFSPRAIGRIDHVLASRTADFDRHATLSPRSQASLFQFINSREVCTSLAAETARFRRGNRLPRPYVAECVGGGHSKKRPRPVRWRTDWPFVQRREASCASRRPSKLGVEHHAGRPVTGVKIGHDVHHPRVAVQARPATDLPMT